MSRLAVTFLVASTLQAGACDRGEPASGSAPGGTGSSEAPPSEAPPPASPVAEGSAVAKNDAVAESLPIEQLVPGLHWVGPVVVDEVLLAIATSAWRLRPGEAGVVLSVGGAPRLAARLGLRDGDTITAIGELPIRVDTEPRAALEQLTGGERVEIALLRDGSPRTVVHRVLPAAEGGARQRVEDIVAVGRTGDPDPSIERAILVAFGQGAERLRDHTPLLLEVLGLPTEATEIAVDGQSIEPAELARVLGERASAERVEISAGGSTLALRIVSGVVEAEALASAISDLRRPRPSRLGRGDPPGVLGGGPEGADPAPTAAGIEKVDDTHVRLQRATLDEWMADPASLAKMVRVIPWQKDGAIKGFKLFGIRRTSVLSPLGFENGDAVESVNGHALDGMDASMKVFTKLRSATKLEIELNRRGKPITLTIEIVESP